ncbi:MAG: FMN-binding negative transcriptional regulator [Bacteroidota bacterium]
MTYIARHYRSKNHDEVRAFVRQYNFGILVNQVEENPWATPIPLEPERNVQRNEVLVGPIAKANAQGKSSEETPTVLGIFNGSHACTSSSW